ncbi:MAG: hypothetical protein CL846_00465 [Crocinitomicaceae bacterium]|nr:hypothetical protein [Crocinitomicaceae bacterium]|tara:strand:- start:12126 stop:13004 length:879 start_codon:yes stop_codon:yes gene_type:complete
MSKHILFLFFFFTSYQCFSAPEEHSLKKDTLKILSWNIQMLPNLYAPFTKLVRKKQKIRLPEIIKYLEKSNFDIIVLQEVFDIQMKNKLKKQLSNAYPYMQLPIKKGWGIKLSNGVMFLSKHPINLIDKVIFNVSKKSDRMAQKGCALIELDFYDQHILVAGTHLDSKGQKVRDKQYNMVKEQIISPYKSSQKNFFLAGDLNTEQNSEAFKKMIALFELNNHPLNEENPYTFDSENSWINYKNKGWIDYILYQIRPENKIINQYIIRPKMSYKNKPMDLADHYGIVLEIMMD